MVVNEAEENLKYMWIVKATAIRTLICFSKVYDFAKDNSGALKPGVQSVEGAVKTVVGPLYQKVHGFPNQLLKFVDRKVCFFAYINWIRLFQIFPVYSDSDSDS